MALICLILIINVWIDGAKWETHIKTKDIVQTHATKRNYGGNDDDDGMVKCLSKRMCVCVLNANKQDNKMIKLTEMAKRNFFFFFIFSYKEHSNIIEKRAQIFFSHLVQFLLSFTITCKVFHVGLVCFCRVFFWSIIKTNYSRIFFSICFLYTKYSWPFMKSTRIRSIKVLGNFYNRNSLNSDVI